MRPCSQYLFFHSYSHFNDLRAQNVAVINLYRSALRSSRPWIIRSEILRKLKCELREQFFQANLLSPQVREQALARGKGILAQVKYLPPFKPISLYPLPPAIHAFEFIFSAVKLTPPEPLLISLLRLCRTARRFDLVLNLWREGVRLKVQPLHFAFGEALTSAIELGDIAALRELLKVWSSGLCRQERNPLFTATQFVNAFGKLGQVDDALLAYQTLLQLQKPNVVLLGCLIKTLRANRAFDRIATLWDDVIRLEITPDTALLGAFAASAAEAEDISLARKVWVFLKQPKFSSLLDAPLAGQLLKLFVARGELSTAFSILRLAMHRGVADAGLFASLLSACAQSAHLSEGQRVHDLYLQSGLRDIMVETALVDMYARCGYLDTAMQIFNSVRSSGQPLNAIFWTVGIGALGVHGKGMEALKLYEQMMHSGIPLDAQAITAVLQACAHAGLVQEALDIYSSLPQHSIAPDKIHVNSLVDLLARAGRLDEAEAILNSVPSPQREDLVSLLAGCKTYRDIARGERIADRLIRADPSFSPPYVLLSNLYASVGLWEQRNDLRRRMERAGAQKIPGQSVIEVDGSQHVFMAGDNTHPDIFAVYCKLSEVVEKLQGAGHQFDLSVLTGEVKTEEEGLAALCGHSEKLAISFGLLKLPPGADIRVTNNLRICSDCHAATKLLSRIYGRRIIVRDRSRFHDFQHGKCSCGDYW